MALNPAGLSPEAKQVRRNVFKEAIKLGPNHRRQIGLWSSLRSPMVAEFLSHASGLDWFVIDMEHGPSEINDVLLQLIASQTGKAEPVVRVPWNEPVVVKRILDLGCQSILFPMVNNAEEAKAAVAATRYPPHGVRGVMSTARMSNYGANLETYYKEANSQICVICQIETPEAVDKIEEIAAVEGVDGLFVGPADLAATMGHLGNSAHPEVRKKIEDAFLRIKAAGKPSGFISYSEDCKWVLRLGCNFCALGTDLSFMADSVRAATSEFHQFCAKL